MAGAVNTRTDGAASDAKCDDDAIAGDAFWFFAHAAYCVYSGFQTAAGWVDGLIFILEIMNIQFYHSPLFVRESIINVQLLENQFISCEIWGQF